jgi:hypothetical protein
MAAKASPQEYFGDMNFGKSYDDRYFSPDRLKTKSKYGRGNVPKDFMQKFGSAGVRTTMFAPGRSADEFEAWRARKHAANEVGGDWRFELKDIDGDDIDDAAVYDANGDLMAMNGFRAWNSGWTAKSPKKYADAWKSGEARRTSVAALHQIRKNFGDAVIKPHYHEDDIVPTGSGLHRILPLSKIVSIFINTLSHQSGLEDQAWKTFGPAARERGMSQVQALAYIHSQPQYRQALINLLTPYSDPSRWGEVHGMIKQIVDRAKAFALGKEYAAPAPAAPSMGE